MHHWTCHPGTPPCSPAFIRWLVKGYNTIQRASYLEVHVAISAHEETLVLQPPFQADVDGLAGKLLQERLGVHWIDLGAPISLEYLLEDRLRTDDMVVEEHVRTSKLKGAFAFIA
jgi:hypothetical protein